MITYIRRRRLRKSAKELLRHSRHIRNTREDVMPKADYASLVTAEQTLSQALRQRKMEQIESAIGCLSAAVERAVPPKSFPGFRENLEIIAVAVAVAMGFRTYVVQPFKIPTGSMQPTLYGIYTIPKASPGLTDRMPLKLVRWLILGDWYLEIRAAESGYLDARYGFRPHPTDPSKMLCLIGQRLHWVPKDAIDPSHYTLNFRLGEFVRRGAILWSGNRCAGDHVFVDKIRWNFVRPRRGDITVFSTKRITSLEETLPKDHKGNPISTHYIKRLAGLPGEKVVIDPPNLLVNDKPVTEPEGIRRIVTQFHGYPHGYLDMGVLATRKNPAIMGQHEYLLLGDNTANSRDSRYWGPVPEQNLVGPAFFVYWPFSRRWGIPR
ncbi:MAG: signal peptidase I [Kiritimatiellia bacterium]